MATTGCSHNYFNIPKDTYVNKVKVLGVAPIFVDGTSDIRHPNKDELVTLLKEECRKNESELVSMLRESGGYKTVLPLANEDPDKLFDTIFFRREQRDDAGVAYNKYFFKEGAIRDIISRNQLDALLIVVLSGINKQDKIYSSNFLSYLESDYNYLIMTSQILNADNQTLWEFPNFRQRFPSLPPFLNLQYPDFDEAKANATESVSVKFKTIQGIARGLSKGEPSTRRKGANLSNVFADSFGEMMPLLKNEPKTPHKPAPVPPNAVPATLQQPQTTTAPVAPQPAKAVTQPIQPAAAPEVKPAPIPVQPQLIPPAPPQPEVRPMPAPEPQTIRTPSNEAKPQQAPVTKLPEVLPDDSKIQPEPPPVILNSPAVKTE
jgi:hypothetical protein